MKIQLLKIFFCSLLGFCILPVYGQIDSHETERRPVQFEQLNIGYQYSFPDSNAGVSKKHLLELTFSKGQKMTNSHGSSIQWYSGTEIGVANTSFPLIAPKIGGYFSGMGMVLGSEVVYYTDFREGTLRYVPYFGIGGNRAKLSIQPQIRISNRSFEPLNRGQLNITYAISSLKQSAK